MKKKHFLSFVICILAMFGAGACLGCTSAGPDNFNSSAPHLFTSAISVRNLAGALLISATSVGSGKHSPPPLITRHLYAKNDVTNYNRRLATRTIWRSPTGAVCI